MKFLAEQDVPEKLRLLRPLVKELVEELPTPVPDPLPEILRTLVDVLKKDPPGVTALDLTPIVEAIRAMPTPAPAAKEWTFTIQRNSDGVIETVHAQRRSSMAILSNNGLIETVRAKPRSDK